MKNVNDFGARQFLCAAIAGVAWVGAQACEGTQREFVSPTDEAPAEAARGTSAGSAEPGRGVAGGPGDESTIVTQLQPPPGAEEAEFVAEAERACVDGSTESCGPPREEGICKFGTRTCTDGAWGECVGGVSAAGRNCASAEDNDCDGQPDNTLDDVCVCPVAGSRTCEEHEGLDGRGQCTAGEQACVPGEGNLTSDWGPCVGSAGPGAADSCDVVGDDTNCDGVPNGSCPCVEGTTQPCGPETEAGICQRGVSTCRNGVPSACEGAVFAARRDCTSAGDNDCDGRADNTLDATCTCIVGDVQPCGTHPGRDGNGSCRAGQQTCEAAAQNATSRFGACTGSVGPAQRDSCSVVGDDSDCNGIRNGGCQCIAGQGNAPCSGDANNSRCSPQGSCAPCQADADCSLVSGGRSSCTAGQCVVPAPMVPVVTVQRFAWTSRQAPVSMGTTTGRACFLTRVGGAFNAAGDSVQILQQGGQWVLTGAAPSGFVEARAACVAAQGVTTEASWQQGADLVALQSSSTHVCFFTRLAGDFQGTGENVQLRKPNGVWELDGESGQQGVGGSARCMLMQPEASIFSMLTDDPSTLLLDPLLTGACYLNRLSGNLVGEGDFVETEWNGSSWELRRQTTTSEPLRARAACFGRNDGSGVPAVR